jgi:CheY-like chemotaxis protein
MARIFELFTRVEHGPDRPQSGLGIGLALVRRLVEMHGGTVTAHSEGAGSGSEFVIRLPVARETAAGERDSVPSGPATTAPTVRRRILIADDNLDALDSTARLLQYGGHEVFSATDGSLALQAAERHLPEVALLDIGMPGLDGYEVARRIRAAPWGRDLTLVAITGWGQEADRRRSQEAGFDSHLVKPVNPGELAALLARLPQAGRANE